ncbi:MAG: outer membrane lipoprotein carrier protein LolA [Desulfatitalea sp.]|nr:outer membrane lipoprotein carrier protein LolA [Desulfatitalea sp.]NNK01386.1 outer membrane lipoprotein carrier protein LolA [Desulfatitalea sp.]
MRWALLFLFMASLQAGAACAADTNSLLDQWLDRQVSINTWSADVAQIRQLKSLTRPLESKGRVWFKQPNRFRWQLGDPPRTIAVRTADALMVIYPLLRQAERYPLNDVSDPAWRQVLTLLEVGFPSDAATFYARYEVVSAQKRDNALHFELRPSAPAARRLLDAVRLKVAADTFRLLATELIFPDGSTMRNLFSNHQLNPDLSDTLFHADLDESFRVVEPLKR